jgi:hypothetical protein
MAFGEPSKHTDCPRCEELKNGATPIQWNIKPKTFNKNIGLKSYCFSVSQIHSICDSNTNPKCACGKMSYCD